MFVAYALLFLLQDNKFLLLKRANNVSFGAGLYHLPGGKINNGETARQAVIREAAEEIGITINPEDLDFKHLFNRKGKIEEIFAVVFTVKSWQGKPYLKEPDKHEELAWFNINELPSNIIPAHKQAIENIVKNSYYSEHGW